MSNKKLIVNADDFGQSEGINSGIIKAHELGIVTSASLMVRYNAAKDAAEYAKKNQALGIGLHIDLGEWIYNNGNWDQLYEVVPMDDIKTVAAEINKQLESFYKLLDRKPDHLNSHQHVHQRENLKPVFLELANKLDITLRGCSSKVNYCGDFYGQLSDGSAYHTAISVEGLKKTISKLPEGITELACHPGFHNDIKTMYRIEREMEVDTLCNAEIKAAISYANIERCNFESIGF